MYILVGADQTDHIAFFCPHCEGKLNVRSVNTDRMVVNTASNEEDNCTYISFDCPNCEGSLPLSKFYWESDTEYDAYKIAQKD